MTTKLDGAIPDLLSLRVRARLLRGTPSETCDWFAAMPSIVEEIRSADGIVSPYAPEPLELYFLRRRMRGHIDSDCTPDELIPEVAGLDYIPSQDCYLQLTFSRAGGLAAFEPPAPWCLLGYDLIASGISSVHNCGPWEPELATVLGRLNRFGLFSREDALTACRALPRVWGAQEHHAFPDPIAVYEWDHAGGVPAPWQPRSREKRLPSR